MVRRVLLLCALGALAWAQGGDDLASRVEKLERMLREEKEKGAAREDRIRELEGALQQATDALARSYDRRAIQEEIDEYLASQPDAAPGGGGDGWSSRLSIAPLSSFPTLPRNETLPPARTAATAWLAPFPPGIHSYPPPRILSPPTGMRSVFITRSILTLPITRIDGLSN